jgi:hypothetical protein
MMRLAPRVAPNLNLSIPADYAAHRIELGSLVWNLLLEGSLLHVRAVLEFLFPRGTSRPTDICARVYSAMWDDSPEGKTIADEPVNELRARIDRHLMHLTFHRIEVDEPRWANRMFDDVVEHFRRFRETLSPERQAWFDERYLG